MREQERRLEALVEAFKRDSADYRDLPTPPDAEGRRRVLRSLMNIRMPAPLPRDVLHVQDAYLRQRAEEKGVVALGDIPTIRQSLGSRRPCADALSIWQGDITRLACDAIVNAANSQMLGCFVPMHSCIDNCIHTFAGVQLRAECAERMRQKRAIFGASYEQPTAEPMLTDAYNLPCRKVVHIVGPIVSGALTSGHEAQLSACYRNTLDLCEANGLRSVAFCCISTGVFCFPARRAAEIAAATATDWLMAHAGAMDRVIFNVFRDDDRRIYEALLSQD